MPKQDFKPPKPNGFVHALAKFCLPYVLNARQVDGVDIPVSDLDLLRSLKDERLVLMPNHPTNTEPAILFDLSAKTGGAFHYVACREAFNHVGGLWGWVIQRLGAYSLVRGSLDRASFSKTRELIAAKGSKVVIFPEGEVYSQNDSLLPFQTGVVQLAFWGFEEARRTDPSVDVRLLPVAVRYTFTQDMTREIADAIERLERAVGLKVASSDTNYDRIRRVGERVVAKLESQYELKLPSEASLGDRMDVIKRTQLDRAAQIAKVSLKDGTLAEQMRSVINAVHRVTEDPSGAKTDYDYRLWEEARNHMQPALHELDRLSNWIAVYDGYVASNPSPERMVHLLVRMEKEVLGSVQIRGRQKAHVRLGNPISLAEFEVEYSNDKRATVASVTEQVEESVQALLDELARPDPKVPTS